MGETTTGLCISGPLDGQFYAAQSEYLHTPVLKSVSFRDALPDAPVEHNFEVFTYRNYRFLGFGFWIPKDMGVEELVSRLIQNYRPIKKVGDQKAGWLGSYSTSKPMDYSTNSIAFTASPSET